MMLHPKLKYIFSFLILFMSISDCKSQSTIIWQITNPNRLDTSYIVGTYHQLGNSFIDSFPIISQSLFSSEIAIFESIDSSGTLVKYLNSRSNNYEYKKILKKSDILFLENYTTNWAVPVSKLTPVELLMKLDQELTKTKCGTINKNDTWYHFDNYLIYLSKINGIKMVGLETDSLQTLDINNSVNGFDWKKSKKYIHKLISLIRSSKSNIPNCKTAKEYMSFSFDYQFDTKCGDKGLIRRNQDWLNLIIQNLEYKKTFIAVGLLHLYGECGLIEQLRQIGYIIEPLEMKKSP